jgi:hypothetical protein
MPYPWLKKHPLLSRCGAITLQTNKNDFFFAVMENFSSILSKARRISLITLCERAFYGALKAIKQIAFVLSNVHS